ncbi:hypothetical protein, partial [Proteus mirabilis]|uniref:hypothetical protein n=1 Tax=Proteus mirabilis TaxID=584 RepID=UPI00195331BE
VRVSSIALAMGSGSGSVLACLGFTWGIVQAASIVTLGANMSSSTMAMFFISFAILVVLALE